MTDQKNVLTLDFDENKQGLLSLPVSVLSELIFPLLDPGLQEKIVQLNTEFAAVVDKKEIWQGFIYKYFPYLVKKSAFKDNPRKLFLKEYTKLKELSLPGLASVKSIQLILASLSGDFNTIKNTQLTVEAQKLLYVISAANGHPITHLDDNGVMEAFIRAASIGNEKVVVSFLDTHQMTFKTLEQALENAALHGHIMVLKHLFLKHKHKIAADPKGQALRNAARHGRVKTTAFIIEQCKDEISTGFYGRAFEDAAEQGHAAILAILTNTHVEIEASYKGRAFNVAAQCGRLAVIEYMLNHCLKDISYVEKGSALNYAAEIGHADIVRVLLQQAGNDIDNVDKESALTLAASKGFLPVVQAILIAVGNEIDAGDKEQALQIAQNYGHGSIVEAFKQYNVGHAFKDAATFGQVEMVQWLLERASDEITSEFKGLALGGAAKNGYIDVIEVLLDKAANEIDESYYNRAIHLAQDQGYENVVVLLQEQRIKKVS